MANEINIAINTTSDLSGLNQVDKSVKSLKTQLKEAEDNVLELSAKFGATSKEAIAAANAAGQLKEKMGDAKSLTDTFNPGSKFKALNNTLSGVVNAVGAVSGALGKMGVESKATEKAISKVQDAMALASGVEAIGESVKSFTKLGAVIKNTTVFQKISTAAQWLWNAAMNANPIGAIVVAITALIGVGYLMINMFKSSTEKIEASKEAIEKNTKAIEKETEKLEENRKKKEQLQDYELRLMKARGKSDEAIAKRAILLAKENEQEAWKEYRLKLSTLEMAKNTIATYESTQAKIDDQMSNVTWMSTEWGLLQQRKDINKQDVKLAKEKLNSLILAHNSAAKVVDAAHENTVKAEQNLNLLLAQQKTDANKQAEEDQKKLDEDRAAKRKQEQEKKLAAAKTEADKDAALTKKYIQQKEDALADTETKKAILLHTRNTEEIAQMKNTNAKKITLDNEYKAHTIRMTAAMEADKEAEYNKSVEFMELADAGYKNDLQKQLEHYQHLLIIQQDYGKSTVEIEEQIKLTQKQIVDDKKQLHDKFIKETEADNYKAAQKKLKDQYDADVAEINLIKDKNQKIQLLNELKIQYEANSQKLEIEQRASTIQAISQMAQTAADIGSFIADRIAGENVQDKQRKKTAVRVGAASSIAGVIAQTAQANAGFLANPASVSTLGLAAAAPIAASIASSTIAIANILNEKNKAIREIDDAGGVEAAKPSGSKFATGGLVQGMGTSTSDSIIANLSNGESVINAKSTAMFGNLLSSINEAGGGVSFANKNQANPIFKTYVVASEMTSQIEANLKLKQIARL